MEGRACPPRRSGGPAGADRRGPEELSRRSRRALTRAVVPAWSMARQSAPRVWFRALAAIQAGGGESEPVEILGGGTEA